LEAALERYDMRQAHKVAGAILRSSKIQALPENLHLGHLESTLPRSA
jgi:hypothetical protein